MQPLTFDLLWYVNLFKLRTGTFHEGSLVKVLVISVCRELVSVDFPQGPQPLWKSRTNWKMIFHFSFQSGRNQGIWKKKSEQTE